MGVPSPSTKDHENDPVVMVVKSGQTSGLTVGRLNTVCSFTRYYFKYQDGWTSKETAVLHRPSLGDLPHKFVASFYPSFKQLTITAFRL